MSFVGRGVSKGEKGNRNPFSPFAAFGYFGPYQSTPSETKRHRIEACRRAIRESPLQQTSKFDQSAKLQFEFPGNFLGSFSQHPDIPTGIFGTPIIVAVYLQNFETAKLDQIQKGKSLQNSYNILTISLRAGENSVTTSLGLQENNWFG